MCLSNNIATDQTRGLGIGRVKCLDNGRKLVIPRSTVIQYLVVLFITTAADVAAAAAADTLIAGLVV